jgi:hypothetical protein
MNGSAGTTAMRDKSRAKWPGSQEEDESYLDSWAIRQGALDAICQALRLEPRMISLFRLVWDPNDPTRVSSEDNDLEIFMEIRTSNGCWPPDFAPSSIYLGYDAAGYVLENT